MLVGFDLDNTRGIIIALDGDKKVHILAKRRPEPGNRLQPTSGVFLGLIEDAAVKWGQPLHKPVRAVIKVPDLSQLEAAGEEIRKAAWVGRRSGGDH